MTTTDTITYILLIILSIHATLYAVAGVYLLYVRKEQHDRSRIIIASLILAMMSGCCIFISSAFIQTDTPTEFIQTCLEPYPSIFALLMWILLPMYLLEIQRPNWLNVRRISNILAFWLVCSLVFVGWHISTGFAPVTPLYSVSDVIRNIHETDVILRVMLALMYIPYGIMVAFIRYDWRTSNAPQPWIKILSILAFVCTFTFIGGMLLRIIWIMLLHLLVLDTIVILVFYMELRVRIPVPESIAEDNSEEYLESVFVGKNTNNLTERLRQLIIQERMWQNPDLQSDDVCRTLATNHTYLTLTIQSLGYTNFADMINRQRVDFMRQQIEQYPNKKLLDIFFEAGFRNRNTATRNFQQYYNYSPQDYRNSLIHNK